MPRREPRITVAKLRAYVKALEDRDGAKAGLTASPEDSEAQEILQKMEEALSRGRNTLKH